MKKSRSQNTVDTTVTRSASGSKMKLFVGGIEERTQSQTKNDEIKLREGQREKHNFWYTISQWTITFLLAVVFTEPTALANFTCRCAC